MKTPWISQILLIVDYLWLSNVNVLCDSVLWKVIKEQVVLADEYLWRIIADVQYIICWNSAFYNFIWSGTLYAFVKSNHNAQYVSYFWSCIIVICWKSVCIYDLLKVMDWLYSTIYGLLLVKYGVSGIFICFSNVNFRNI